MDGEEANLLSSFALLDDSWNRWMYYVLPVAAVLQWVLVAPLAVRADVLTSDAAGFAGLRGQLPAGVEPTGFLNDYFFIVWNLFPLVLWASYVVSDKLAVKWIRGLEPYIDTTEAAGSIRRLRRIRDHRLVTVAILFAGVAAMAAQVPKQLGFFDTNSQLYWWDWRIDPAIFVIRDLALFFNVILVVLVFWGTLFALATIVQTVRHGEIVPDLFHPDGAGGLLPLGNAMSVLVLPWVAGAFLGVLGFFDHTTASELLFRIGDVLLVVTCTGIGAVSFAYPLYLARSEITEDIESIQDRVHDLVDQHGLAQQVLGEDPTTLRKMNPADHSLTDRANTILLYQRLDEMNGWPVANQRIYQVVLLLASPGITVLTNAIRTFIRVYWF